ncbi:MAG: asparagine synthase (glutamine-hydrolyzing) [Desulfobacteraceae bacterium]|nr:asparagine synthase (glutamine-hydrolyzing) [Desulfobacteraceae bacterium]
MCGFAGILRRDGQRASSSIITRMLGPLQHRGPDGSGIWAENEIALGHLRLSILDLSERASQPMATGDGEGVLVYNGEVYNYRELRGELEREGVGFVSTGDTEVVLKALLQWGPKQAIPRFNGMFAFAYFDRRNHALWLARDRLGIKPLYVAECGPELLFGSEPRALLAHPAVSLRPDPLAVATFVMRGRPDPRLTLYEGITAIEPGYWWRVDAHGTERRRWFHVQDAIDIDRLLAERHETAVYRFEQAIDESVRLHLASDVGLAAICSGGVDSGLITALANRRLGEIQTYVAELPFEEGEGDFAQRVADSLGICLTRVPIDREQYLRHWPEAIFYEGHPSFHRSNVALLALVRKCRADGFKVLLNGEGADELFGGYRWHENAFLSNKLNARIARALIPPWFLRRFRKKWFRGRFTPMQGVEKFNKRAVAVMDGDGESRRLALAEKLKPVRSRADRAMLARSLDDLYYSLDTLLRRHDRMAMATSVEMRVPFIENNLIDLGIHLPRRAKYHRGQTKWVVKQAAQKLLPYDIVHAEKRAFPMPPGFDAGAEKLLLKGAMSELIRWSDSAMQAIITAARRDHQLRFLLVGFELWAQLNMYGATPEALSEELLSLTYKDARV